jgi:hypothetical protein
LNKEAPDIRVYVVCGRERERERERETACACEIKTVTRYDTSFHSELIIQGKNDIAMPSVGPSLPTLYYLPYICLSCARNSLHEQIMEGSTMWDNTSLTLPDPSKE